MSAETELAAAQSRIAAMENEARQQAKTQAITAALQSHAIVPGAHPQLVALLEPTVTLAKGVDGREVAVSTADYRPVDQHIADILKRPDYSHFVRPATTSLPAAASSTPASQQALSWDPIHPDESLGERILRRATAKRNAEPADPRLSTTLGFGLRVPNR